MKSTQYAPLVAGLLGILLLSTGCQSSSGGEGHEAGSSAPAKVVYMDPLVAKSVTSTGLQANPLADGRLEVAANLKNLLNRRIQVEVQCVFKDVLGFSTVDETPWRTLILTENGEETVRFVSLNNQARGYAIRVREAH